MKFSLIFIAAIVCMTIFTMPATVEAGGFEGHGSYNRGGGGGRYGGSVHRDLPGGGSARIGVEGGRGGPSVEIGIQGEF